MERTDAQQIKGERYLFHSEDGSAESAALKPFTKSCRRQKAARGRDDINENPKL